MSRPPVTGGPEMALRNEMPEPLSNPHSSVSVGRTSGGSCQCASATIAKPSGPAFRSEGDGSKIHPQPAPRDEWDPSLIQRR